MPHCIIEHASSISPEPLLKAVYQGALDSDLFDSNDIKVRSTCFEHYQSGTERFDFVHVILKILDGRSTEQKSSLSSLVLSELLKLPIENASFTVEVVDIERACYAKEVRRS